MAHAVAPRVTKVPTSAPATPVVLLSGKDAGKRGAVQRVERPALAGQPYRVVVEGLNLAKRHTKPRPKMNQTDRVPGCSRAASSRSRCGGDRPVMLVCRAATAPRACATWPSSPAPACGPAGAAASRWR